MPLLIYAQSRWACQNILWRTVEVAASSQMLENLSVSTWRRIQQGCHILTALHIFTNSSFTQSDIAEIRQRMLLFEKRTDMRLTVLTPQDTVTSTADSNIFLQLP